MKAIRISGLILVMALAGCAYRPIVSYEAIKRLHSVKVVYIQPSYILAIQEYDSTTLMPMMLGGGRVAFIAMPAPMPKGDFLTNDYLSDTYRDEITPLDARPRLLAAATHAISQVSWLANAPLSVVDHSMDLDDMRHDVLDSNMDAVVYLEPVMALSIDGRDLRAGIVVTVYVNHRTGNEFNYVSRVIPDDEQEVQLKPAPNGRHRPAFGHSPKELAQVWFADDAAQLHSDIDSAVSQVEPGIIHFLAGDMPETGN